MMWKRTVAATLGAIAAFASLIAFACPIEGAEYVSNPFLFVVFGHAIMWSLGLGAVGVGIRLLRFAWSGRYRQSSGWMRQIVLGIGCFFPGFMFSLPITMVWAGYRRGAAGDGVKISFYIGVLATIVYWIVQLKKPKAQRRS
ncbi:MAG TPA: hypothetical protein VK930_06175 [Verrucomicrobiae bacterium]|jgi:hypothetical protein|nr:hypothetical protein [Verrucomicrobiae bacterium]